MTNVDHSRMAKPDAPGMQAFDFLRRSVYDCIAAGKFPQTADPETISQSLWAGVHGVTSILITCDKGFPFVERDQLIHSVVNTLVAGASQGV